MFNRIFGIKEQNTKINANKIYNTYNECVSCDLHLPLDIDGYCESCNETIGCFECYLVIEKRNTSSLKGGQIVCNKCRNDLIRIDYYDCIVCNAKFRRYDELVLHQFTHSPDYMTLKLHVVLCRYCTKIIHINKLTNHICKEMPNQSHHYGSTISFYSFDGSMDNNTVMLPTGTDTVTENTDNACKICFTNELVTVNLPCTHMVFCIKCALEWNDSKKSYPVCPVCNQKLNEIKKVYR
jgi:uncharacterized CHY-type Zn-finger protein